MFCVCVFLNRRQTLEARAALARSVRMRRRRLLVVGRGAVETSAALGIVYLNAMFRVTMLQGRPFDRPRNPLRPLPRSESRRLHRRHPHKVDLVFLLSLALNRGIFRFFLYEVRIIVH